MKHQPKKNPYKTSFNGEVLEEGYSDFHHYKFIKNNEYGICLFLDGIIQSSSRDQDLYHEKMTSQALKYRPELQNVLIIGGAGGGMLHHLLKMASKSIKTIDIVDIDKKLFELAPKYMSSWCKESEFTDHRVTVTFDDGANFLEKTNKKFDAIFLDISDPLKVTKSHELYCESVFRDICNRLVDYGVLVYHSAPLDVKNHIFYKSYADNVCLISGEHHSDKAYIASYESSWLFNVIQKREFIAISTI